MLLHPLRLASALLLPRQADSLTGAHRSHTTPAGVNRCAEGAVRRPTATFVWIQSHKSVTEWCNKPTSCRAENRPILDFH
jgi:hypothetical protein